MATSLTTWCRIGDGRWPSRYRLPAPERNRAALHARRLQDTRRLGAQGGRCHGMAHVATGVEAAT